MKVRASIKKKCRLQDREEEGEGFMLSTKESTFLSKGRG